MSLGDGGARSLPLISDAIESAVPSIKFVKPAKRNVSTAIEAGTDLPYEGGRGAREKRRREKEREREILLCQTQSQVHSFFIVHISCTIRWR